MEKRVFKDNNATAGAFAEFLYKKAQSNDSLTIALSGGSTPKALFKILAEEYQAKIDWSKLHFFWGDERMVAPDHEESNFKMTNDLLLSPVGVPSDNIHRVLGENELDKEVERYGALIRDQVKSNNGLPAFDIVMLGIGGDGHTASIFPPDLGLMHAEGICAAGTNPESGQKRVTLTGPVINNSKHICFLVTGAGKAEKIDEIFNRKGGYKTYPAAHVNPTQGQLTWFMDESANEKLK